MDVLELSAPRPLTPDENASLMALLRSHLRLTNCSCVLQAEEDATDLLTYALDMIEDGAALGKVLEELAFMEIEICDDDVLENMKDCLAEFLGGLRDGGNKKKDWRESAAERELEWQAMMNGEVDDPGEASERKHPTPEQQISQPDTYEAQLLNSESHVFVDLSAATAANKSRQEMENLFGRNGCGGLKSRMSMYNERGELVKHEYDEEGEGCDLEVDHGPGKSLDEMRREELMLVMNDRSLTKNERAKKMDEIRAKYGLAEAKQATRRVSKIAQQHSAPDKFDRSSSSPVRSRSSISSTGGGSSSRGGVDLSAKAASEKHAKEMASLFGSGKRGSLKERMSMYNERGEIIKNHKEGSKKSIDNAAGEKSQDMLRREELMSIMKEKSPGKEERAKKMEDIRQKYGTSYDAVEPMPAPSVSNPLYQRYDSTSEASYCSHDSDKAMPPRGGVDLSAKAASEKHAQEIASLFGSRGGKTAMSNNRKKYERQLLLDTPQSKLNKSDLVGAEQQKSKNHIVRQDKSDPSPTPTLDQQRRAELQNIMRDSSLKKEERRQRMVEVKQKYAALAKEADCVVGIAGRKVKTHHQPSSMSSAPSSTANVVDVDLSAKSYSQRPRKEMESLAVKSLSDRKSMYNNQSTIVAGKERGGNASSGHKTKRTAGLYSKHRTKTSTTVDHTAFAVAENGLYGVYRQKKRDTSQEYGGRF